MGLLAAPALAVTWVVDGRHPACSDLGPGDAQSPFCTIGRGATRAAAGDTVMVHPATYREQVTPPSSGAPNLPVTYRASGPEVVILGTDDLSNQAGWSPTATTAWSRPFAPSSTPTQVFVDGARLSLASGSASTTPGSFFYDGVAKVLYVDLGGPNPADGHMVEAGARTYGFSLVGRSHLVIEGFEIHRQNHTGVRFASSSSNLRVLGNTISNTGVNGILSDAGLGAILIEANDVSRAASIGIRLLNSRGVTVSGNLSHDNGNHGIALQGSGGNLIEGNISHSNARPDVRAAAGLDVNGASVGNVIRANTFFANQDSGFQVYNGSNDNLVVRNVSHHNGDHGFDTNKATGTRYVSNTCYGNLKDGFSVEGTSTGTTLANNIAVDNGLESNEFDLFVDAGSVAGFSSDYDIFHKSAPGAVVRFNLVAYATLDDFAAATGNEAHGTGADPMFVDGESGDLRVGIGPAVDSADSGADGFSMRDQAGSEPVDIPDVDNTGAGSIAYADRGAFELLDPSPVAHLEVTPSSGRAPLPVVASARGSTDNDGIVSYLFDFGDGTSVGPQTQPIATHIYVAPGEFTVTLVVKDTAGQSDSASKTVRISPLL